jgi:hypothetical protein
LKLIVALLIGLLSLSFLDGCIVVPPGDHVQHERGWYR